MKKLLLVFVFILALKSHSQQQELLETTWYLQEVVLDGVSYPVVNNDEVSGVQLYFYPEFDGFNFETQVCNGGFGQISFNEETQNSSFDLWYFVATLIMCQQFENNTFEGHYFWFFWESESTSFPAVFDYEIFGESENRTLIITNEFGNQVIYSSQNMSVSQFENYRIVVYPNPVSDVLQITGATVKSVTVTDISGKTIITSKSENIDFSGFKQGIYFVKIEDENGFATTKKVVRK